MVYSTRSLTFRSLLFVWLTTLTFSAFAFDLSPAEQAHLNECEGVIRFAYHARWTGVEHRFKTVGKALLSESCCIATASPNTVLLSLLSRGAEDALDRGIMNRLECQGIGPEYGTVGAKVLPRIQYVVVGLIFLLILIFVFWLWGIHLARKVREKTEALQQSEERFHTIFQNVPDAIFIEDEEGIVLDANPAACAFHGIVRGELIGKNILDLVPEEHRDEVRKEFKKWFTGEMECYEGVSQIGEGRSTPVEVIGVPVRYEGNVAVLLLVRDTTKRKRAEQALRESEKRLSFLFEELPHIAVKGYNAERETIFWNRASEEFYGYSKKEALGKKVEDLVLLPESREDVISAFDAWVNVGTEIPSGEMIKCHADGREIAVYSSCLATRNQHGDREMYVIDVDLSQLKRANEELVKAKDYAEKASRAKSEFLANISHEIRTPMNGVMGMTGLLLDTNMTEEQRDYLQTIMESTRELMGLIDELLDISRIEAGEVRLTPEPFSPRETVEKVVLLFADRSGKKGVDLSVAIHPNVPEKMMGDAGRIRQILINLVGNALKFTHDGHIQIRMQAEKIEDGWNLFVDVKDTGIGMPPELQTQVFDKFTQGDSSSKRKHGGAGLGLAITKQLVELMGGTISVDSEEGTGTSFDFNLRLPDLEWVENTEAPVAVEVDALPEINADILLVEDNLVNQKVAVAMLKKLGCRVSVALNGAQALKQIPDHKFDLIFMDCQMPILDGFETTRAIRQMVGEIRDIPIVAMTAHALKEDRQQCLDSGMDDYIAKPVHRDKLIAVLRKYCK